MTEDAQMKIRLARTLKEKIEAAAEETNRTLNGEIVARLERTFIEDAERESGGTTWIAKAKANSMASFEERLTKLESEFAEFRQSVERKK